MTTKNNQPLEEKLKTISFRKMSQSESAQAWSLIAEKIDTPSIFTQLLLNKRKTMIPLLIGALLFASAGGTVAASNSAVPGDALFGVDRAVENVRIAFAGNGKAELKLKFAEERLQEVEKIIAEARLKAKATSTATSTPSTATSTATSTKPTKATSTATSTPRGNDDRVALGISVALDYLNDISADLQASGNTEAVAALESAIDRLEGMANTADVKVLLKKNGAFQLKLQGVASSTASSTGSVRINTNGNKDRIEIREDGDLIRIELKKDGEVRIKSKTNIGEDDSDDDSDDEDEDNDDKKNNRGKGVLNASSTLRIDLR